MSRGFDDIFFTTIPFSYRVDPEENRPGDARRLGHMAILCTYQGDKSRRLEPCRSWFSYSTDRFL